MPARRGLPRSLHFPRFLTSWIAIAAVLLMTLVPPLAQLAASGDVSRAWMEICSVDGPQAAAGAAAETQKQRPGAAHLFEHCPYCSLHAQALGTPPAAPALPLIAGARHEVPDAFLSAPRTLYAWAGAQSRAPPARA